MLGDSEVGQRQLIHETEAFTDYIDERVLWIQSAETLGLGDLVLSLGILRLGVCPNGWSGWRELVRVWLADARQYPVVYLAMFCLLLSWAIAWRRVGNSLAQLGRNAATSAQVRIWPTIQALLATVLVGSVGPEIRRNAASPGGRPRIPQNGPRRRSSCWRRPRKRQPPSKRSSRARVTAKRKFPAASPKPRSVWRGLISSFASRSLRHARTSSLRGKSFPSWQEKGGKRRSPRVKELLAFAATADLLPLQQKLATAPRPARSGSQGWQQAESRLVEQDARRRADEGAPGRRQEPIPRSRLWPTTTSRSPRIAESLASDARRK